MTTQVTSPVAATAHGPAAKQIPSPRSRRGASARRQLAILPFLLPALLLFGGLVLVPILLAIYTSLFKWNGFGGLPTNFVGLDNFVRLLGDEVFTGDLSRGLVLVLLSVALGLALLLNQQLRFRGLYRLIFFAPYVLSEVITGVLFTMVLSPNG